jgi:3-hydroxyisobutyrate dehydrogenase-like beta-hydroxyacid dehydrogenase
VTVGLLHPGSMGAAIGAVLRRRGELVLWASDRRSTATAARAAAAGLEDAGTVDELARRSDVILSVCPPHVAVDVARSVGGFAGVYVDANAVSPATAREIGNLVGRFVDGGIVGGPPRRWRRGKTRLYLSGPEGPSVAALFDRTTLGAVVISSEPGAASALKMAYAAWSKGTAALILAILALARAEGVEESLLDEWRLSSPELSARSRAAARTALAKGWRFAGEMEEIGDTFAAAGLPDGFHRAAAEIYRRVPREDADDALERALQALLRG